MALAVLLDALLGDLPNRWHPTAWMGTAISQARRYAPKQGAAAQFGYGAAVVLGGALTVGLVGKVLTYLCQCLPTPLGWMVEAYLLKQSVAMHGLGHAAHAVYVPLAAGDEVEARRQLSWHLVSRDTSDLDPSRIAAATIESVAENSSDGVIAPLFYYACFGLPGALVYRWINTIDSLWGYRDPAREWLGKAGARVDDVANLLPARLSALLIIAVAAIQGRAAPAWNVWRRDAGLTASPNAGHPMSAMAGALQIELEKIDHYQLGAGFPLPVAADIPRSVWVMRGAVGLGVILSCLLLMRKQEK